MQKWKKEKRKQTENHETLVILPELRQMWSPLDASREDILVVLMDIGSGGNCTATDRKSAATAIPLHQQLHHYRNPEANPINSNTL